MLYRVKQFLWAATARVKDEDLTFIDSYLDEYEKSIFFMLPISTQVHCIKVAKEVLKECKNRGNTNRDIIKAAFLHDIGQVNMGLNGVTKSIMVIGNRIFPYFFKKLYPIKFVRAYYEHSEIALEVLKTESEYVKFLVKNHHNYQITNDEGLTILQAIDSKN